MRNYKEIMREIVDFEFENNSKLLICRVDNVPIWRVLRYAFYKKHLSRSGCPMDFSRTIGVNIRLKNFISSFFEFIKIAIYCKADNLILAFTRPNEINGLFFDKISDPVIEYTDIKNSYLIFQRRWRYKFTPRIHKEHTIFLDFVDYFSIISSYILFPFFFFLFYNRMQNIVVLLKKMTSLSKKDQVDLYLNLSQYLISKTLFKFMMKRIKVKNMFVVSRNSYLSLIAAAKECNIKVFELQHGAFGDTVSLYTSLEYDSAIDPDLFLVFGEKWINNFFAIPLDKIKYIGWAYKNYLLNLPQLPLLNNSVLVISSPEISTILFSIILELSDHFKQLTFYIRPHPLEQFTQDILMSITTTKNLVIADNTIESMQAIVQYPYIVGLSSTMLYEALSLNKRVGVLNFPAIAAVQIENVSSKDFCIIDSLESFSSFICKDYIQTRCEDMYYGDFNSSNINNLLN